MSEVESSGDPEVEQPDDLFGRWLAHHSRQVTEEEKDLAEESAGPADPAAAGIRPSNDMDRQVPGFEPIIMPSARRKQEQGGASPRRGLRRSRAQDVPEPPLDLSPTGGAGSPSTPPATPLTDAAPPTLTSAAEGRRPTRSTSGEEPDWLRALRDPAPVGATAVPEPVEVAEAATEPEVAAEAEVTEPEAAEPEVTEPEAAEPEVEDVVDAEIVEVDPVEAEPQEADAADVVDAEVVDVLVPETGEPGTAGPADPTPGPPVVEVAAPATPAPAETPAYEPTPTTRSDDLDWLSIIRDPGAHHVAAEPTTAEPTTAEPEPTAPDAPGAPPTGVDRLRGPAQVTQVSEPAAEPVIEQLEPTAEPEPEPEPDWRSSFRDAVAAAEAEELAEPEEPADSTPRPEPVVHRVAQARSAPAPAPEPAPEPVVHRVAQARSAPAPEPAAAAVVPTTPEEPATEAPAAAAPAKAPDEAGAPRTTRTSPITSMPDVYTFRARRTARRLVTLLLGVGVLVTAYLVAQAYNEPTQSSVAVAALAAFVTAIVWAVRASTVVTTLVVREGTLEVTRAGTTDTFDLTGAQSPVELVGVPGERGWKALLVRSGKPPFELTSSEVDPVELTRVVRYHRPGEPTS